MTAPSDFNSISELDATLVFRVAYDGSSYSGFAEQPGQTTVAGELRRAIETLLRRPIDLTCAGRTDAACMPWLSTSACPLRTLSSL